MLSNFVGWCLLAVVIFVLLCSRAASGSQASTPIDLQPAVCRIHNQLAGMNNLGSGTLIDKAADGREGLILTCAHLFHEGVGNIVVTFADGRTHGAKLVHVDRQADLAALAIANPRAEPVEVSFTVAQQSQLFACGYGSQGVFRCAVGPGIGEASGSGQLSLMIADGVRSGDSGGGVFDNQGRLVAVIWGESQGVTYASYGRPLQNFLGRVLGQRTSGASGCVNGVCPRQPPRVLKPILGQPLDPGSGEPAIAEDTKWGEFVQRIENERKADHATLLERIGTLSQANGAGVGRAAGKVAVGLLGVSGPAGWGILAASTVGGWWIGRRMKRRVRGARGRRRRPFRG